MCWQAVLEALETAGPLDASKYITWLGMGTSLHIPLDTGLQ
jgi:hypothetical protein